MNVVAIRNFPYHFLRIHSEINEYNILADVVYDFEVTPFSLSLPVIMLNVVFSSRHHVH